MRIGVLHARVGTRAQPEPAHQADIHVHVTTPAIAMGSRCFKCIAVGLSYRAKLVWLCFFGPRLKRVFYKGSTGIEVS